MPANIGSGVTLQGLNSEDFSYTWNISGTAGVNPNTGLPGDVVAAMVQDTATDFTAKVSADTLTIIGALASYENRVQEGLTVGAIRHKGVHTFAYTGTAPTRGQGVVGSATAGKVKTAGAAIVNNVVVAVNTTLLTVTVKLD